ncbi:unnamed protein product [Moneuplotes crassus]|uniref:Uncharacterized protein n=1 Tax=Euplotes crassus TaxID=5936 RepID=A0AAD1X8P9_EUPCR|nr:unnamed protein product [Moneuplotes crassus]
MSKRSNMIDNPSGKLLERARRLVSSHIHKPSCQCFLLNRRNGNSLNLCAINQILNPSVEETKEVKLQDHTTKEQEHELAKSSTLDEVSKKLENLAKDLAKAECDLFNAQKCLKEMEKSREEAQKLKKQAENCLVNLSTSLDLACRDYDVASPLVQHTTAEVERIRQEILKCQQKYDKLSELEAYEESKTKDNKSSEMAQRRSKSPKDEDENNNVVIEHLKAENKRLKAENKRLKAENKLLKAENERLKAVIKELGRELAKIKARFMKLELEKSEEDGRELQKVFAKSKSP